MTRAEALELVLDAAWNWANELTEYIAPASEDFGDDESAEAQVSEADQIADAIALLRGGENAR